MRERARCGICGVGDSTDSNMIVYCDGVDEDSGWTCGVAVHQDCYSTGPVPEGRWLCDACKHAERTPGARCANTYECLLCHETSEWGRDDGHFPDNGRWGSAPLATCAPPVGVVQRPNRPALVHWMCANTIPQVYEEEEVEPCRFKWDEAAGGTLAKERAAESNAPRCHVTGALDPGRVGRPACRRAPFDSRSDSSPSSSASCATVQTMASACSACTAAPAPTVRAARARCTLSARRGTRCCGRTPTAAASLPTASATCPR